MSATRKGTNLPRGLGQESGSKKQERTLILKLFEENNFERSDGSMRGLIGTVKAEEFISFLTHESDSELIDERLFDENIRLFCHGRNE